MSMHLLMSRPPAVLLAALQALRQVRLQHWCLSSSWLQRCKLAVVLVDHCSHAANGLLGVHDEDCQSRSMRRACSLRCRSFALLSHPTVCRHSAVLADQSVSLCTQCSHTSKCERIKQMMRQHRQWQHIRSISVDAGHVCRQPWGSGCTPSARDSASSSARAHWSTRTAMAATLRPAAQSQRFPTHIRHCVAGGHHILLRLASHCLCLLSTCFQLLATFTAPSSSGVHSCSVKLYVMLDMPHSVRMFRD